MSRRLSDYPTVPIASARMGEMIKIVGKVRATEPTFTAPLTGATCVHCASIVEPYLRWWYADGKPVVETRSQDLLVDDDSGSALVRMHGADVTLIGAVAEWGYEPPVPDDDGNFATTENVRNFLQAHGVTLRYRRISLLERFTAPRWKRLPAKRGARYREGVLREGDSLAVLGRAVLEPDPAVAAVGHRQPALRLVLGTPPDPVIASNLPNVWE